MHVIHIGQGARSGLWRRAVDKHPKARSTAIVAPIGGASVSQLPSYDTLASALGEVTASLAVVSGSDATRHAIDALASGLSVIMDEPGRIGSSDLERLRELSQDGNVGISLVRRFPYSRCKQTLKRFVSSGRLGALGHVSCIDHREFPRQSNATGADSDSTVQLSLFACDSFEALRRILGVAPVNVTARSSSTEGTKTEAFLEMEKGIHIHYFGVVGAVANTRSLWLEGSEGSLRTDGAGVWWRKRGWRFFVPVRFGLSPSSNEFGDGRTRLDTAAEGMARRDTEYSLDMMAPLAAAYESARRGQAVAVPGIAR